MYDNKPWSSHTWAAILARDSNHWNTNWALLSSELKISNFKIWTSLPLVTYRMQQEIVCISKFWDISGVWKALQFWYVFIRRFDIIYLKTLVKSTIFFLGWYFLSPGHTTKNSAWYILIIRYLKSLKYKKCLAPIKFLRRSNFRL